MPGGPPDKLPSSNDVDKAPPAQNSTETGTAGTEGGTGLNMRRNAGSSGSIASSTGENTPGSQANDLDTASANDVKNPLQAMPGLVFHAVGGLVGGAALASGWAAGKLTAKGDSITETTAFRVGFKSWLYANGIWPKVLCEAGPYGNDLLPLSEAIKDHDARLSMLRSTPLIVSNHVSYLDTIILPLVLEAPKLMAMKEVADWPLFGQLCKEMEMIWVDRSDPQSRQAAKAAILDHAKAWQQGDKPLLVWPEGTTSNGKGLKEFKTGSFAPGQPVRPVILKYTGDWDPANVNFREVSGVEQSGDAASEGYGDKEWATQFLGHLIHTCTVLVCKPYKPTPEEMESPELFSQNVRALMLMKLEELDELVQREAERRKSNFPDLVGSVGGFLTQSHATLRTAIAPRVEEGRQWLSSLSQADLWSRKQGA